MAHANVLRLLQVMELVPAALRGHVSTKEREEIQRILDSGK